MTLGELLLRDRCMECGAPLKGSWTIHAADCSFYRMLVELTPDYVEIKDRYESR